MLAFLVLAFFWRVAANVEVYRAWPSTGGPSYSWRGSAADWQRTWQNNTDQYQRNFPIFETADELFVQSSRTAFAGTSNPDGYRYDALLSFRPYEFVANCNFSNCDKIVRLQNILSEIGSFKITMDVQQSTQTGWQDFALGMRSYFLTALENNSSLEIKASGIGFAVGIRTAFLTASYQSDRLTTQTFRADSNSTCYRKDCNTLSVCGIPCEVRIMNSSYVELQAGTLETPWLNVTYEVDANASKLSISVWNGSTYIVPKQDTFLSGGIKIGSDLAIGLGVYVGSMRIRNFIITTNAIAEPPTASPTPMPTPFPTVPPTPVPTFSPSPSPTKMPTPLPTPVSTFITQETSTMPKTKQSVATNAPATNAENGSSGISIFAYATPVALLLAALACFAWRKAQKHEQTMAQYALADMAIEPLPPSRPAPMVVHGHSGNYASILPMVTSAYVRPEPQQPDYGELSISSGTGYEPSSPVDVPAYGITSLANETSRSRRNSRQR